MGFRIKTLTVDCNGCNDCVVNENNEFLCMHGVDKKGKIMKPAKGKKPIKCNLKK